MEIKQFQDKTVNKFFNQMWQDIKNLFFWFFSGELSQNQKICTTISLAWIIFIGYLTWWNGLKSFAVDKSFRWDEWFWFGIVPALAPYLFYYIWKNKK